MKANRAVPILLTSALIFLASLAAQAQEIAGHYELRGVMEVGSELWLKPDGTFEYMLAYGAADYWAKGTWKQEGKDVVLHSTGKRKPRFDCCAASPAKRAGYASG